MKFTVNMLLTCILFCGTGPGCELFANTVGRFLLRITSLSSYVFLRMVFPERSRRIERLSLTLRGKRQK